MLVLVLPTRAPAQPARSPVIHVRGETHVSIRWHRDRIREATWPMLEGQVADDAARPLAHAAVSLQVKGLDGAADPDLAGALTCADAPAPLPRGPGGGLAIEADSDGRFCVRLPLAVARYHVRAEAQWEPAHYDAVALEQDLDIGKPPLSLWLEGGDGKPDLGKPTYVLTARIGYDDFGRLVYAPGLPVTWQDDKGQTIATATSAAEGHLRFEVPTSKLGDPGLARHKLACAGSEAVGPAETTFPLEKRAHLELVLDSAPADAVTHVELPYALRVRMLVPGRDLFASGALVQATFGGQLVGTAEADAQGNVLVPVLLDAAGQSGSLELRATAQVPYLLPSEPLRIPLEVSAPRSWRSVWLFAGFLALVAWLAIGRAPQARRALAKRPDPGPRGKEAPPARAEILVTAEQAAPRWMGSVKDAHDRSPVARARVELVRPGFAGRQILSATTANDDGAFVLEGEGRSPGDRLVIHAALHRTLDVDAPAFGTVTVTTISRRRGLLQDFARWAQGRPWAGALRRKATPLDAAVREEEHAAWATRVDAVVFGPSEVDAQREASARVPGGPDAS